MREQLKLEEIEDGAVRLSQLHARRQVLPARRSRSNLLLQVLRISRNLQASASCRERGGIILLFFEGLALRGDSTFTEDRHR
jgi:hypothetical protein